MMYTILGRRGALRMLVGLVLLVCAQAGSVLAQGELINLSTLVEDESTYVPNEVVVCFGDTSTVQGALRLAGPRSSLSLRRQLSGSLVSGAVVKTDLDRTVSGLTVVTLPPNVSVQQAIASFSRSASVVYVEPNYKVFLHQAPNQFIPNDARFPEQWGLDNFSGADINAPEAWDAYGPSAAGLIVAVLDTGVDFNHPDLQDNLWYEVNIPEDYNEADPNTWPRDPEDEEQVHPEFDPGNVDGFLPWRLWGRNFLDDPENPTADVMDDHFHGTHVSGIIGAIGNNNIGIAGVCHEVTLLTVKVFDGNGVGAVDGIVAGIDWAVETGAKVINMSYGSPAFSQTEFLSISDAGALGVMAVASAGNSGAPFADYPARYASMGLDNVISVVATDRFDQLAYFSNYGEETHLGAPGIDILSTTPLEDTNAMTADPFNRITAEYGVLPGTSQAAPHVTGAVALAMVLNSDLSVGDLQRRLLGPRAVDPTLPGLCQSGGRLNLHKFLNISAAGEIQNVNKRRMYGWREMQKAVDEADPGDLLIAEHGYIYEIQDTLTIDKDLTLRSGKIRDRFYHPTPLEQFKTVIWSNRPYRYPMMMLTAGPGEDMANTLIQGFAIEEAQGAGILLAGASTRIEQCYIHSILGNGIHGYDADAPILSELKIYDNEAGNSAGAGIFLQDVLAAQILDCEIYDNTAFYQGGGVCLYEAGATVSGCDIHDNYTSHDGGGLYTYGSAPVVVLDTYITNNLALHAGGAVTCEEAADVTLKNVLMSYNQAQGHYGGALYCYGSSPTVQNCTLSHHGVISMEGVGGAILLDGGSSPLISDSIFTDNNDVAIYERDNNSEPTVQYCLFYDNPQGDYFDYQTQTGLVITAPEAGGIIKGTANLGEDPMFVTGRLGNFYLSQFAAGQILDEHGTAVVPDGDFARATSPAVDAGSALAAVLNMNTVSTRTDNFVDSITGDRDEGIVDIGFHYVDPCEVLMYSLNARALPNRDDGDIEVVYPAGETLYREFSQLLVRATTTNPGKNRFKNWLYTNDDTRVDRDVDNRPTEVQENTITIGLNRPANAVGTSQSLRAVYETIMVRLRAWVTDAANGTVTPERGNFERGSTITLTAERNDGAFRVRWIGSDDDFSTLTTNTVTFTPPFNVDPFGNDIKEVEVRITKTRTTTIGPNDDLQTAIDTANDHDIIVLKRSATPYRTQLGFTITRPITITGENPSDPGSVAQTVIEPLGNENIGRAFTFMSQSGYPSPSTVGPDTVLSGLTIRNYNLLGYSGDDADPGEGFWDGFSGSPLSGFGVLCVYASPTLKNVVFTDIVLTGGDGGNGANGDEDHPDGGGGGWPGAVLGAAMSCFDMSDPTLIHCRFMDCYAQGGNGGNGGDADDFGLYGQAGGYHQYKDPNFFGLRPGGLYLPTMEEMGFDTLTCGVGGAFYADRSSSPSLRNCTFTNCGSGSGVSGLAGEYPGGAIGRPNSNIGLDSLGGAVYIGGFNPFYSYSLTPPETIGQASFVDCTFIDCNSSSELPRTTPRGDVLTGLFENMFHSYGGAVAVGRDMKPIFKNCLFTENRAAGGGAFYSDGAQPEVEGCSFTLNAAFTGGAYYARGGQPVVNNSNFSTNQATELALPVTVGEIVSGEMGQGGAIASDGADITIIDTRMQSNVATLSGGAVYISGGTGIGVSMLKNCLLNGNASGRDGGGLTANWLSNTELRNCTIVNNVASGIGPGTGLGGGVSITYESFATIIDSILWGNLGAPGDVNVTGDQLAVGDGYEFTPEFVGETSAEEDPMAYNRSTGPSRVRIENTNIGPEASDTETGPADFLNYGHYQPGLTESEFDRWAGGIYRGTYYGSYIDRASYLISFLTNTDSNPSQLYGVDGWRGFGGQDRIVGVSWNNTDPNSALGYVYTVSIPVGESPNTHPNNESDTGEIAKRTFFNEYIFDVNLPSRTAVYGGAEFYVNELTGAIYYGVTSEGIQQYTLQFDAYNKAQFGPSGNYVYAGEVTGPVPERETSAWSLAFDPNQQAWYTQAIDPNNPSQTEVWKYTPTIFVDANGLPIGSWDLAFTYPTLASPYSGFFNTVRPGMEFVNETLLISYPAGDAIAQYAPTGALINVFRGESTGPAGALGFGAFDHFWVSTSNGQVAEVGVGDLNSSKLTSFGPPILVERYSEILGYDPDTDEWEPGLGNFTEDPLFTEAGYFLSHIAAGDANDSPCIDAGSAPVDDPNVMLDPNVYTTRVDGIGDMGIVDMGYHNQIVNLYELTVQLLDPNGLPTDDPELAGGYVTGGDRRYPRDSLARLVTHPNPNLRPVWSGTDNDENQTTMATVTMTDDTVVKVRFVSDIRQLTVEVIGGHGTVTPGSGPILGGLHVLTAHPDPGYRVRRWIGTAMDPAWNTNEVTILMSEDRTVQVEFEQNVTQIINVPGQYTTLQEAVAAAGQGDTDIVLEKGTYPVPFGGIDTRGKAITIRSRDWNDPLSVQNTIIDVAANQDSPNRAFVFQSGEGPDTKLLGLTIRNGFVRGNLGVAGRFGALTPFPFIPNKGGDGDPPVAEAGKDGFGNSYGGAILCTGGSSPTIHKCVFENCTAAGGMGGAGAQGQFGEWAWINPTDENPTPQTTQDGQWGGLGGAGYGNGYGGAIACREGSHPVLTNCQFKNNLARGGIGGYGGMGGNAQTDDGVAYSGAESSGGAGGQAFGDGFGGALYADGGSHPVIQDCLFANNIATVAVGGLGAPKGDGTADEDTFAGAAGYAYSNAAISGGAVYVADRSAVTITNSDFIENRAWDRRVYEAGYINFFLVVVSDPEKQKFEYRDTRGGAIFGAQNTSLDLTNLTFTRNSGAAVFVNSNSVVDVNNCQFNDNEYMILHSVVEDASFGGVGDDDNIIVSGQGYTNIWALNYLSLTGFVPDLSSTWFWYEDQSHKAGALQVAADCKHVDIRHSRFSGNKTTGDGGALLLASDANLVDCWFGDNIAGNNAGAIKGFNDAGDPSADTTIDLFLENCIFVNNQAAYAFRRPVEGVAQSIGFGITLAAPRVTTGDSVFTDKSGFGGALYLKQFMLDVNDCYFMQNQAKNGGAAYLADGTLRIRNSLLRDNLATGASGIDTTGGFDLIGRFGVSVKEDLTTGADSGGALVMASSHADIQDCIFQGNAVEGPDARGGAITFYGGAVTHQLKNCLFSGNHSMGVGGAVSSEQAARPEISNCSFVENRADQRGGGLYFDPIVDANSLLVPSIVNNIFQQCGEYAIVESDRTQADIRYNVFHDNGAGNVGRYVGTDEVKTVVPVSDDELTDTQNLLVDPLLVDGTYGGAYLYKQGLDPNDPHDPNAPALSPAIDAGQGLATDLGLDTRTTTIDGLPDEGIVDIGFHYPDHRLAPYYTLTTRTLSGQGIVRPASGSYVGGQVVEVYAVPMGHERVSGWQGTTKDTSTSRSNLVVMDRDQEVGVYFRSPRMLNASQYRSIQHTIDEAQDGDSVIIPIGVHTSSSRLYPELMIVNKGITLSSEDPGDPNVAHATVLRDYTLYLTNSDILVEGLTFSNHSKIRVLSSAPTIRNCYFVECFRRGANGPNWNGAADDADNGTSTAGGALEILDGAPLVQSCDFSGCYVVGGDGGPGDDGGGDEHPYGYDGGWAGGAYGGAVYTGYNSAPIFEDCLFENCYAQGGNGGDGGAGANGAHGGRGGNWVWADSIETGPGTYPNWWFWDGWQYGQYDENGYPSLGLATYDAPETGHYKPYWKYSGYGGAAYCENDSSMLFRRCQFTNNRTIGGRSGVGGGPWAQTLRTPSRPMKIDNFGGTVYAAYRSELFFEDCVIENSEADVTVNTTSGVTFPSDFALPQDIYVSYGGAIAVEDQSKLTMRRSRIQSARATVGGAIYARKSEIDLQNTDIRNCTAYHGGGVYTVDTVGQIQASQITQNNALIDPQALLPLDATDPNVVDTNSIYDPGTVFGFGGGLYALSSPLVVEDSLLTDNRSSGTGGGLYVGGSEPNVTMKVGRHVYEDLDLDVAFEPELRNCLITGNVAARGGGGGVFGWHAFATIRNCTVADNRVTSTTGYGGGLYFGNQSSGHILDSIVWNNVAAPLNPANTGDQLAVTFQRPFSGNVVGAEDALAGDLIEGASTLKVTYSLVGGLTNQEMEPQAGIFVDPYSIILGWDANNASWHPDVNNYLADPHFVGGYFLYQEPDKKDSNDPADANSPAVNAGSGYVDGPNIMLDNYSTRTDGGFDVGIVDLGYHVATASDMYQMVVEVIPDANGIKHGIVDPRGASVPVDAANNVISLMAIPDPGYRVKAWYGTDNDDSTSRANTVTVTEDNLVVQVEFEMIKPRTITIPGDYDSIQKAVFAAMEGDVIIVDQGEYYGDGQEVLGQLPYSLVLDKPITIRSTNPEDPCVVAATVIDGYLETDSGFNNMGVVFTPASNGVVLNGLTIRNCGGIGTAAEDGVRVAGVGAIGNHPDGYDGMPLVGAGIYVTEGAAPIIKNCVIRDNILIGGNGGNGVDAEATSHAGRGGWGGWARGAGAYCAPGSKPQFINCLFENNRVRGGDGGDGGNGADGGGQANYGGLFTPANQLNYDPTAVVTPTGGGVEVEDQELWKVWQWDHYNTAYVWNLIVSGGMSVVDPFDLQARLAQTGPYVGDYRFYSGYGGAVYCDEGSEVRFVHCTIRGNEAFGGTSGIGGTPANTDRNLRPLISYTVPSYGAGVYCAKDSIVTFDGCTVEDNIVAGPNTVDLGDDAAADADAGHALTPYQGWGGGVCAEQTALLTFVDCNIVNNQADTGGGVYLRDCTTKIVDSYIAGNEALRGGGLYGANGELHVQDTNVVSNFARLGLVVANDPNLATTPAIGAGLALMSIDAKVWDCKIFSNLASYSGGGLYVRSGQLDLFNSLVLSNQAGRDGGGVSINAEAEVSIRNSSFHLNSAPGNVGGDLNYSGLGGAVFCGYESQAMIIDSILWQNFAPLGSEIAVAGGQAFDPECSQVDISYSAMDARGTGVYTGANCTLNQGEGMLYEDPQWLDYYLSQPGSGQGSLSPCVDAGSGLSGQIQPPLSQYTTRTDQGPDQGRVDMGYHRPMRAPCRICDLEFDGVINALDFALFESQMGNTGCSVANGWCQGADVTYDGVVDELDRQVFMDCNGVVDVSPPRANPPQWAQGPYMNVPGQVEMSAQGAIDDWGWPVVYAFESVGGDGHDSGWQMSNYYQDRVSSAANRTYSYRFVVSEDRENGNMTAYSETRSVGDQDLPPAGALILTVTDIQVASLTVEGHQLEHSSGVQYRFQMKDGESTAWLTYPLDPNDANEAGLIPTWQFAGLNPATEYEMRYQARAAGGQQLATPWSDWITRSTLAGVVIPPTPDPMEWSPTDFYGYALYGTPVAVKFTDSGIGWSVIMTAVDAMADSGGAVQYFFECRDEPGFNSGWQDLPYYLRETGTHIGGVAFRVKARDMITGAESVSEWMAVPLQGQPQLPPPGFIVNPGVVDPAAPAAGA